MQAERNQKASTLEPDLDNANVGNERYFIYKRDMPYGHIPYFIYYDRERII